GRNYPDVRLDDSLSGEWKVSKDTLMFQLKAGIGAFSSSQSFRLVSVTSREMRLQNFTTHTHEGVQEFTFKRQKSSGTNVYLDARVQSLQLRTQRCTMFKIENALRIEDTLCVVRGFKKISITYIF